MYLFKEYQYLRDLYLSCRGKYVTSSQEITSKKKMTFLRTLSLIPIEQYAAFA